VTDLYDELDAVVSAIVHDLEEFGDRLLGLGVITTRVATGMFDEIVGDRQSLAGLIDEYGDRRALDRLTDDERDGLTTDLARRLTAIRDRITGG